jgi:hypothetical protein
LRKARRGKRGLVSMRILPSCSGSVKPTKEAPSLSVAAPFGFIPGFEFGLTK